MCIRDSGTHYTGFKAGNNTASVAYVLPTADGTAGHQLTTDGSGTLSWSSNLTISNDTNNRITTATGSSGLNAEASLTFDGTTLKAEAGNPILELSGTTSNGGNTFMHINANANHWCVGADNYTQQNMFVIKLSLIHISEPTRPY